ncbi:MAG: efflux RND transporter periplasmic adaptor subunit [Lutibacter sp.]|uniref:efflux RND transporter periplasmic adaptor subunit n=1 Tax=Lutibacter sp. TaxID=1925666 RepID=UPI0019F7A8DD|nr:efflux RND transporter periplasmic adaptor subunit [Lutibacter sp.]NOR28329.1 efflux RND transporter periplasmic adaptor subunit [Lutibacter sp.]
MKKYIIYIGILISGLLLGYVLFGSNSTPDDLHNHELSEVENQQWTCSMHPQILKSETGNCPICGMGLIPTETSIDGLEANQFKMSENALALANIKTTVISSISNEISSLMLSGKIKENEKTNSIQTAHFGGRIEKLFVNSTGEKVYQGQLLALIYSPQLVTAQKELLTALESRTDDSSLYNAVRNKLKLWKLSNTQINKIENSKSVITNFPIYANVNGIVTLKMVEEGSHIKEGQGLFTIANLSTVWADFDAYEKQLSLIKEGDEISITTNANPNKQIKAKISFIDPVLNTSTRTVIVRAELRNNKGALKPGMFVKGTLSSKVSSSVHKAIILIPKTAVLWTGKRSVIYVKKLGDASIFEMREVILGNEIGENYVIIAGLENGEEIVTNGTFTVDAAAQLQGKKSMMNKTGGKVLTGHENHIGMRKIENTEENIAPNRIKVATKFQAQLNEVFKNYMLVKDALANDNHSTAKKSANELLKALQKVDMKLLTDTKSHNLWMAFLNEMNTSTKNISATNSIKNQRAQFILLSTSIEKSIAMFGINQKVYHQFCPMANNDKGAFWLSTEEEILNPYFGASMLKCGTIEAVLE